MHKKQKINKYKFCFHSDCLSETLSFSAGSLVKFPCDTLAGINFVLCLFVDCLRAQTTLHTKRNIKIRLVIRQPLLWCLTSLQKVGTSINVPCCCSSVSVSKTCSKQTYDPRDPRSCWELTIYWFLALGSKEGCKQTQTLLFKQDASKQTFPKHHLLSTSICPVVGSSSSMWSTSEIVRDTCLLYWV